MSAPRNRYRITFDHKYEWFVAEIKRWWLPLWYALDGVNFNTTEAAAEKRAVDHANRKRGRSFVKDLGLLP